MKQLIRTTLFASALLFGSQAGAALPLNAPAPDFSTKASLGGQEFTLHLADALKQGPVVLYFYPAAFTEGCTLEARSFAQAIDQYKAYGATVVGVSADNIGTLKKFSVSECAGKFAVAADTDQKIIKAYDAVLDRRPEYAQRLSYVISPEGRIIYAYSDMNPEHHVANTLQALHDWRTTHGTAAK